MELVPCTHDGINCNGCGISPIRGTRYKCRNCEYYNFCENCFYTKRNHRHPFSRITEIGNKYYPFIKRSRYIIKFLGAPEISAGKPGRYYKSESLDYDGLVITDFSRCVKSFSVSSHQHMAHFDIPGRVWQSCGAQGEVSQVFSIN